MMGLSPKSLSNNIQNNLGFKRYGKFLLAVSFILPTSLYAQSYVLNGIKISPASNLVYTHFNSSLDLKYFKIEQFKISPQIGIVRSWNSKNYISDISIFVGSKKVGLTFANFAKPVQSNYISVYYISRGLYSKFAFGYLLGDNSRKLQKWYLLCNFGLEINAITKTGGTGSISDPSYIRHEEYLPYKIYGTFSSGLSLRYRTRTPFTGLIDIGLTYDHCFTKHPEIIIEANFINADFYGKLVPIIDLISIDFIKYFKIVKKSDSKKRKILANDFN